MNIKLLIPFTIISILMLSCSKEDESFIESVNLISKTTISEKEQAPRAIYDTSERGIYHGVIASGVNQTRGKIWVNVGNNTRYTALVEMVNGDVFNFELERDATFEENPTAFTFKNNQGGFTLDVSNPRIPRILEASLYNQEYLSRVLKSTSLRSVRTMTGTFSELGNPSFSGTWNLISNGATNPNGYGGKEITASIITWNSRIFEDSVLENFTSPVSCLNQEVTPAIDTYSLNGVMCDNQVSEMGISKVDWSLSYESSSYTNYTNCSSRTSGLFSLNNGQGVTRDGKILIDTF